MPSTARLAADNVATLIKWLSKDEPNTLLVLFYYTARAGAYEAYSYRAARILRTGGSRTQYISDGSASLSAEITVALQCLLAKQGVDAQSSIVPLYGIESVDALMDNMPPMDLVGAPVATVLEPTETGEGHRRSVGSYNGVDIAEIARRSAREQGHTHMATMYAMRVGFTTRRGQLTSWSLNRRFDHRLRAYLYDRRTPLVAASVGIGLGLTVVDTVWTAEKRHEKRQREAQASGGAARHAAASGDVRLSKDDWRQDRMNACFALAFASVAIAVLFPQMTGYRRDELGYLYATVPLYSECK